MNIIERKRNLITIKNPLFKGTCDDLKTIVISKKEGITCLFSLTKKKAKKFLFDITQWTLSEAKSWVKDNSSLLTTHNTDAYLEEVNIKNPEGKKEKRFLAIASSNEMDRHGEKVDANGWALKNFKKNPVMLWMHNNVPNHSGLPIGRVKDIRIENIKGRDSLVFEPEFDTSTDFNKTISNFIKKGLLNAFSVGFLPLEKKGDGFLKQELLEISLVAVPALASAVFIERAKALGVNETIAKSFIKKTKSVSVPVFDEFVNEDINKQWVPRKAMMNLRKYAGGVGNGNKDEIDIDKYKKGFGWVNRGDPKNINLSYLLPHHDFVRGSIVTNYKGVVSSMALLLGARGGIDFPEDEKRNVYNHLSKHYKQFNKVAPDFKFVETQELKGLFDQVENEIEIDNYREVKKVLYNNQKFIKDNAKLNSLSKKKQKITDEALLSRVMSLLQKTS